MHHIVHMNVVLDCEKSMSFFNCLKEEKSFIDIIIIIIKQIF